jgi:hypothetical protein
MPAFGEIENNEIWWAKNNLSALAPPTTANDSSQGYEIGSVWITSFGVWRCVDSSVGAAVWFQVSSVNSNGSSGLYAQTADSTPITNTLVAQTLIGAGVGTLSVPANGFSVGDSFVARLGGLKSNLNNNDIKIDILSNGSVVLASSGLITLGLSTNKPWELVAEFTIRQIGSTGVANIHTNAKFLTQSDLGQSFEGTIFDDENNTTFDTTITNSLDIVLTWDIASASNTIFSDNFVLNKVY